MPWLVVNQTRLCKFSAVPTPLFALEVQRGGIPGQPGAYLSVSLTRFHPVIPKGCSIAELFAQDFPNYKMILGKLRIRPIVSDPIRSERLCGGQSALF